MVPVRRKSICRFFQLMLLILFFHHYYTLIHIYQYGCMEMHTKLAAAAVVSNCTRCFPIGVNVGSEFFIQTVLCANDLGICTISFSRVYPAPICKCPTHCLHFFQAPLTVFPCTREVEQQCVFVCTYVCLNISKLIINGSLHTQVYNSSVQNPMF